jgi:hypothetical protein
LARLELARLDRLMTLLSAVLPGVLCLVMGLRVLRDRQRWAEPMRRIPLYGTLLLAYVVLVAVLFGVLLSRCSTASRSWSPTSLAR